MPRITRARHSADEAAPSAPAPTDDRTDPTADTPTETSAPARRRAPRRTVTSSGTPSAVEQADTPPVEQPTAEAAASADLPEPDGAAPKRRRGGRRSVAAGAASVVQTESEPAAEGDAAVAPPAPAPTPTPAIAPDSWRIRRPYIIDATGKVRYLDTPPAPVPAPESEPPLQEAAVDEEAATVFEAALASEAADVEANGVPPVGMAVTGVSPEEETAEAAAAFGPSPAEADELGAAGVAAVGEEDGADAARRRRRSRRGGRGRRRNGSGPETAVEAGEVETAGEVAGIAETVGGVVGIAADEIEEGPEPTPLHRPRPEPSRSAHALSPLEALVARQNVILDQLIQRQTATSKTLEQALTAIERRLTGTDLSRVSAMPRLAVFVDVPNIMYAAERYNVQVDFGKLLEYVSRDRTLIRASAYAPISDDPSLKLELQRFVQPFVSHGYRIVTKPLKRFADGSIKANFDVELAMDILTMSDRLDIVSLVSGDGDFRRLVEIVASKGVRVEVVAFSQSTAAELKAIADSYVDLTLHLRDLCVPAEVEPRPRVRQPRVDVEL